VHDLEVVHALRDGDEGFDALFEGRGEVGRGIGSFLEDEGGEEGDDFFGLVVCQDVFEDELGED